MYVFALAAALGLQGILALVFATASLALPGWNASHLDTDRVHSLLHVGWGLALGMLGWTARTRAALTAAVLVFGIFYSGLAVVIATGVQPLGMHVDAPQNTFHLLVGPSALVIGLAAVARIWIARRGAAVVTVAGRRGLGDRF
jgi:hypothetical protein